MNLEDIRSGIAGLERKIEDESGFLTRDDKETLLTKTAELRTALAEITAGRKTI